MTDVTEKARTGQETGVGPYSRQQVQAMIDKSLASGISDRSLDEILADAKQRVREKLTRDER